MLAVHPGHPVLQRLLDKRDRRAGHEGIRPLLIIMGGGMRGVYGAGAALALHRLGLADAFETVLGFSTGAAVGAYFVAGEAQTRTGASIYYQECVGLNLGYDFISYSRPGKVIDLDFLEFVFSFGWKRLDTERIRRAASQLYVGATNIEQLSLELLDVKSAQPSMVSAIKASMSIPGTTDPVAVNGAYYLDGWLNPEALVGLIVERIQPTDVLVLPNYTRREFYRRRFGLAELAASVGSLRHRSPAIIRAVIQHPTRTRWFLNQLLSEPHLNTLVLWPPDCGIQTLTTNGSRLRQAVIDSAGYALQSFGQRNGQIEVL